MLSMPCPALPSEWWEALVPIPSDAAVLNFVVNYFEHFDNNDRKDFKVGPCCLMKCTGVCRCVSRHQGSGCRAMRSAIAVAAAALPACLLLSLLAVAAQ